MMYNNNIIKKCLTRPVSTPALESPEMAVSPARLSPEGRERVQENPPLNRGYAQPNERTGEGDNSEENCLPPEDIEWGAESTDMDWTSYGEGANPPDQNWAYHDGGFKSTDLNKTYYNKTTDTNRTYYDTTTDLPGHHPQL